MSGVAREWIDVLVVAFSPDGRRFAFQLSIDGPVEGSGGGLLLFDLERFAADGASAAP